MNNPEQKKFCQRCGAQVAINTTQCPSCGNKVGTSKTALIIIIVAVAGGFLLFSVAIIGILAAIALPNFVGAQQKAKNAMVRANCRTLQIAVESYATDNNGMYPTAIDDAVKSYYPGGGNDGKTPGNPTTNPFTNQPEWPVMGNITDVAEARTLMPQPMEKGAVEYSILYDGKHDPTSYAIRGGSANGTSVTGTSGRQLIISNQ